MLAYVSTRVLNFLFSSLDCSPRTSLALRRAKAPVRSLSHHFNCIVHAGMKNIVKLCFPLSNRLAVSLLCGPWRNQVASGSQGNPGTFWIKMPPSYYRRGSSSGTQSAQYILLLQHCYHSGKKKQDIGNPGKGTLGDHLHRRVHIEKL